jgi:glycerol kinase
MLAGVGAGLFGSLQEAAALRGQVQVFGPELSGDARIARLKGWAEAVKSVLTQKSGSG